MLSSASSRCTSTPRRASAAGRGHQRRRHGQRQRAGAGDDQHRHRHPDRARRVDHAPDRRGRQPARPSTAHRKGPAQPVGHARHRRALAHRVAHQRDDGLVARVGADTLHLHRHRRAQVHAAGHQRRRRAPWALASIRRVSSASSTWVLRRRASAAVGGKGLAQRHAHAVAGRQAQHADLLAAAVVEQPLRLLRHAVERGFQRLRRALPRMQLEAARGQQEADEHRHRIEVDLVAEDAAGIEGGTGAGDEGDGHAQRHRHVHADAARAQAAPHAREERCRPRTAAPAGSAPSCPS